MVDHSPMDAFAIQELIDEIRNGRTEDGATEWKRQWWDFSKQQQKDEFTKDICALANSSTRDLKRIIIGVGANGQLYDAPLPIDESVLQQRLQAINPHPNVLFSEVVLEGSRLSIIRVVEPFDPPYVASYGNKNIVFCRQGSSITTATRAMLDRWYRAVADESDVRILVQDIEFEDGEQFVFSQPFHVPDVPPGQIGLPSFLLGGRVPADEVADTANRSVSIDLSLRNAGRGAAKDLVLDLSIQPAESVGVGAKSSRLLGTSTPWQLDPRHNVYVDRYGIEPGDRAEVRQRIALINPGLREDLVPVRVRFPPTDSAPAQLSLTASLVGPRGEIQRRTARVRIEYKGEKKVGHEVRI
jgi:hypothetical protein